MDYLKSFAISAAGMSVERTRVEVAALNLANANTAANTAADATGGYRPLRAVVQALPVGLGTAIGPGTFDDLVGSGLFAPSASIEQSGRAPRRVHEPGHPLADASGFVSYPAVDPATEMVSMMAATRAYEANVAALNAARVVAMKSLDIGA
jgi:flagellar basal-body rod protein FlgC